MKKILTTIIITTSLFFSHQANALSPTVLQQIVPLIIELKTNLSANGATQKTLSLIFKLKALISDSVDPSVGSFEPLKLGFDDTEDYLAVYSVNDLNLILAEGEDDSFDVDVWNILKNISNKETLSKHLEYFAIYDDTDSDTVAFVEESTYSQDWLMAINLSQLSFDSKESKYDIIETMVHEYAHIVSFNNDQVPDVSEEKCQTRYVVEGCPLKSSYYQSFVDTFWSQKDIEFVDKLIESNDQEDIDEELYDFYEENKDAFITDYAATNPGEDFAESFAHFMLEDVHSGKEIKSKKVNFFFNYPEFIELRSTIQNTYKDILK